LGAVDAEFEITENITEALHKSIDVWQGCLNSTGTESYS